MTKKMSWQEKIARIEQAPKEMQTMVAKAFLRDDIDDESVQYLFNTDTIEELNDPEEENIVEHVNDEEPEGIGSVNWSMRVFKPSGNKNFITTGSGGWNTCIKGYPMDAGANVLANCVGYASGRFNEIINNARGTTGCTYKTLNCNAIGFKERAEAAGLKTGATPKKGAIMCWGNSSAGHVAIVERVDSNNQVYTSESGYGSTAFWNQTRNNNNGRWGLNSNYYFRCFIYLPNDVQKLIDGDTPSPTPTLGKYKVGDVVNINGVYVSSMSTERLNPAITKGTITKIVDGARNPYLLDNGNIGWVNDDCIIGNTPSPTPTPTVLQIGDRVQIIGTGNGSSYGTSNTAGGIGWTRYILKIWEGRPFPYQVGNEKATVGFYKVNALKKK